MEIKLTLVRTELVEDIKETKKEIKHEVVVEARGDAILADKILSAVHKLAETDKLEVK